MLENFNIIIDWYNQYFAEIDQYTWNWLVSPGVLIDMEHRVSLHWFWYWYKTYPHTSQNRTVFKTLLSSPRGVHCP